MSNKELLNQAYHLDLRIESKLQQVESLRSLAAKATTAYAAEPVSGTRDVHKREEIICKIVDLQAEINSDIDRLVDLKKQLREMIEAVPNVSYRTILELRYLNFRTWEEIAVAMGYTLRNLRYMRDKAIDSLGEKNVE